MPGKERRDLYQLIEEAAKKHDFPAAESPEQKAKKIVGVLINEPTEVNKPSLWERICVFIKKFFSHKEVKPLEEAVSNPKKEAVGKITKKLKGERQQTSSLSR